MGDDIRARKDAHLEIAASGRGAFKETSTLLEEVTLVHEALPELALEEVDISTSLFGRRLAAPLMIGAMTGGTDYAARVNRDLAEVAEELGIGFCLGSQRIMLEKPGAAPGFEARDVAPNTLVIGNMGVVQTRDVGPTAVAEIAEATGVDAMAVHLNPAHELVQAGGDRDFRGCVRTLSELAKATPVPLLVKETGCGLSRRAGEAIAGAGIDHVEVGGAGGTSWVRVEAERGRGPDTDGKWLDLLGEWGIPTAASLLLLEALPLRAIAGGGIRSAMDVARALSLGARACAVAQPVLAAYQAGGAAAARAHLVDLIDGLRAICLLTGSEDIDSLRRAPVVLGPRLERWREQAR